MKTTTLLLGWRGLRQIFPALLLLLLPLLVRGQSANIVISQVYAAGGNGGATYNQDFVELFNRSTTAVNIGGWSIQYAASGSNFSAANTYTFTAATIQPGGRYLVGIAAAGSTGSSITADQVAAIGNSTSGLSATSGKVAIANTAAVVTYTAPNIFSANVVDVVGYGAGIDAYEGTARAAAPTTTAPVARASDGCTDTNNNGADFVGSPAPPRNSATPITAANICTNPVLVVNPSALSFSATTGQVASVATYTLAGYNLTPNAVITINSTNTAVLVSTTGAAGSFASTVSVMTSGSGALSQTISVQFTAPATAGTTSASISNNGSGLAASVAVTGASIMAYTWNGTSTSYSAAGSWTPARTTLTTSDVLLFDGAVTPTAAVTLDYNPTQTVPAQTIGQLQFINNVAATLSTDISRTLTLDNNMPGDDFVIRAGSSVTITNSSTAGSSGLDILLTSTETGVVGGTLTFAGLTGTTNGRHTLQAAAAGAVQFLAGSFFQVASTYATASPFGAASTSAGSVVFRNGSRFEQYAGGNPFATSSSVVVFEPTSTFLFGMSGSTPSLAGRTYGNFIYDISGLSTASSTTGLLTIQGDLTVRNGTVSISGTGSIAVQGNVQVANAASFTLGSTGGMAFQGNVQVNDAATLVFAPASAATVQLNGSATQILGGTSTATAPISFNAVTTLAINNAAGITLGLPILVPGTLQLINGLLTTTTANSLTLAANPTGGSNASFVNGPVLRPIGPTASATGVAYVFPVGKSSSYRPITLNVTNQSGTTYFRAEQVEGNPGQNVGGSGLTRVSVFRSFTITAFASVAGAAAGTVTQPSNFTGTVMLSFGSNDGVTDPAAATFVVAKRADSNQPWANIGHSGSTASTLTSGTFMTFSDFVLASTDPNPNPNPLPVVLTGFGATRQAGSAVQVRWATASEQHSAYFEVQRSLDGSTFAAVAKVAAQGTTTQAHTYATLDATAPTGKLYYRLRQVDTDGTETFSPVVTLAATEAAATLAVYPNPAHSQLTIAAAAGQQVQVIDLTGRVLQTTTLPDSGQLSIEALPIGTYLLRAPLGSQQRVLRFTKE